MSVLKIIIDNYVGSEDDRRELYTLKGIAADVCPYYNINRSYVILKDGVKILLNDEGPNTSLINWIKTECREIGLRVNFYEEVK